MKYRTFVFDCDGVILNSNRVKTEGFRHVAQRFGIDAAESLVAFHVQNGGISRYKKFAYLIGEILHREPEDEEVNSLSKDYGDYVFQKLLCCEIAEGLDELRQLTSASSWMLVSGGSQAELRQVFEIRDLSKYFDLGIYGSPDSKDEILQRELTNQHLKLPGLFVGDSRYDHIASRNVGLDFVFMNRWTEFSNWQEYCQQHGIPIMQQVSDLSRLGLPEAV
jgi:phosphoglycolate phosphatase-like HAD superfamily hydrolase